ncbi:hypothetical protein K469DRAFT_597147, partial [Zopfia rhizophila CBS 207.26]
FQVNSYKKLKIAFFKRVTAINRLRSYYFTRLLKVLISSILGFLKIINSI